MSVLKDLMAKGEPLKLTNGVEITIQPLTVKEESEFTQLIVDKQYGKAANYLYVQTAKNSIDGVSDEEIDRLNKDDVKAIIEMARKVNKMMGDDEKKSEPSLVSKSE